MSVCVMHMSVYVNPNIDRDVKTYTVYMNMHYTLNNYTCINSRMYFQLLTPQ